MEELSFGTHRINLNGNTDQFPILFLLYKNEPGDSVHSSLPLDSFHTNLNLLHVIP